VTVKFFIWRQHLHIAGCEYHLSYGQKEQTQSYSV